MIDLENWGADATKVGIGPGKVCITRMKTGFGTGGWQLSALKWCARVATKPIIADGGIREHGDIAKSIRFGATHGDDRLDARRPRGIARRDGGSRRPPVQGVLRQRLATSTRASTSTSKASASWSRSRASWPTRCARWSEDLQSSISYAGGTQADGHPQGELRDPGRRQRGRTPADVTAVTRARRCRREPLHHVSPQQVQRQLVQPVAGLHQRVQHAEVVAAPAGPRTPAPAGAPGLVDQPVLALELARFRRRRPPCRACRAAAPAAAPGWPAPPAPASAAASACRKGVCMIGSRSCRPEIASALRTRSRGRPRVMLRPQAGQHHRRQVAAGRMARHGDARRVAAEARDVAPGPGQRAHHLQHDLRDRRRPGTARSWAPPRRRRRA